MVNSRRTVIHRHHRRTTATIASRMGTDRCCCNPKWPASRCVSSVLTRCTPSCTTSGPLATPPDSPTMHSECRAFFNSNFTAALNAAVVRWWCGSQCVNYVTVYTKMTQSHGAFPFFCLTRSSTDLIHVYKFVFSFANTLFCFVLIYLRRHLAHCLSPGRLEGIRGWEVVLEPSVLWNSTRVCVSTQLPARWRTRAFLQLHVMNFQDWRFLSPFFTWVWFKPSYAAGLSEEGLNFQFIFISGIWRSPWAFGLDPWHSRYSYRVYQRAWCSQNGYLLTSGERCGL